jgi:hypothetical protein
VERFIQLHPGFGEGLRPQIDRFLDQFVVKEPNSSGSSAPRRDLF